MNTFEVLLKPPSSLEYLLVIFARIFTRHLRSNIYSSPLLEYLLVLSEHFSIHNGPQHTILPQLHFCRYILAASPPPCVHIHMDTDPVLSANNVLRAGELVSLSCSGVLGCRHCYAPSRDVSDGLSVRGERCCLTRWFLSTLA